MTLSSSQDPLISNSLIHSKLLQEHYQKYIHFTTDKIVQFKKPTTIHHWQLRDLIHCYWNEYSLQDELFFVSDDSIIRVNTAQRTSSEVIELEFRPVCFHLSFPFLIIGGQDGNLVVKDLINQQFCNLQ